MIEYCGTQYVGLWYFIPALGNFLVFSPFAILELSFPPFFFRLIFIKKHDIPQNKSARAAPMANPIVVGTAKWVLGRKNKNLSNSRGIMHLYKIVD